MTYTVYTVHTVYTVILSRSNMQKLRIWQHLADMRSSHPPKKKLHKPKRKIGRIRSICILHKWPAIHHIYIYSNTIAMLFLGKKVQLQLEGPPRSAAMQLEPFGPAETHPDITAYGINCINHVYKGDKNLQNLDKKWSHSSSLLVPRFFRCHIFCYEHISVLVCALLIFETPVTNVYWNLHLAVLFLRMKSSPGGHIRTILKSHGCEFWMLFDLQVSHPLQSADLDQNVHPKATHVAHVTHVTVWGLRLLKSWSTKCGGVLLKLKKIVALLLLELWMQPRIHMNSDASSSTGGSSVTRNLVLPCSPRESLLLTLKSNGSIQKNPCTNVCSLLLQCHQSDSVMPKLWTYCRRGPLKASAAALARQQLPSYNTAGVLATVQDSYTVSDSQYSQNIKTVLVPASSICNRFSLWLELRRLERADEMPYGRIQIQDDCPFLSIVIVTSPWLS